MIKGLSMAIHPQREQAIQRCLVQGEPLALVAADGGVAASTLWVWLRLGRLERELVAELRQAAAAQAELKQLVDQEAGRAAG